MKHLKNLLISIGLSYHPGVRMLHSMVKDVSDSKILIFQVEKQLLIDENLRIDCSIKGNEIIKALNLFERWILEHHFELIGISFMSHQWDIFVDMTNIIRRALPQCKIIAGGVHAWLISPMETLEHCDYVCAAEGEELYRHLVEALSNPLKTPPFRIPGLIERDGGDIIHTPIKEYMPIDNLPLPTIGSIDIYCLYGEGDRIAVLNEDPQMNSSFGFVHIGRGCPFKCTYCINSLCLDKSNVRIRSVDKVIHELKVLFDLTKFKLLFFEDEVFPLRSVWLKEFSYKYKKEIGVPFVITLYPGLITYEKANLLKEAGLKEVSIGIQSGSENIRKNIYKRPGSNKNILEENKFLSELGIMTYYDFLIKNPFESEYDHKMTMELVSNFKKPFYLKFYTLTYYPKHPITEMALNKKLISEYDVKATVGYLDVTTPHKVTIADHYLLERRLIAWNDNLIKDASQGSKEAFYLLLTSYYGYWFIPTILINFMKDRFIEGRKLPLMVFTSLVQIVLKIRSNIIFRKIHVIIVNFKIGGFLFLINKIWMKLKFYSRFYKNR